MKKFKIGDVVMFRRNCKIFSGKITAGDIGLLEDFYEDGFCSIKINMGLWVKCTPDEIEKIGVL